MNYIAILVIVDQGRSDDVIQLAESAGSTGATVFHSRGSGRLEAGHILSMPIEPNGEVVMIVAPEAKTENIVNTLYDGLKLETPGNGIILTMDLTRTHGLYEPQPHQDLPV